MAHDDILDDETALSIEIDQLKGALQKADEKILDLQRRLTERPAQLDAALGEIAAAMQLEGARIDRIRTAVDLADAAIEKLKELVATDQARTERFGKLVAGRLATIREELKP